MTSTWVITVACGRCGEGAQSAPPRHAEAAGTVERLVYSVPAAAEQLDIGERKMAELVANGEVESIKIGRSRRITHAALLAYVERQQRGETRG